MSLEARNPLRRTSVRLLSWLLVPLFSLLLAGTAAADLESAMTAYGKGDFGTAFKGFQELAKLGQPVAQYNLAVMYVRGEGSRQSDIFAYAWASLAAKNGYERAQALVDRLRPNLALAPGSEQIAADIESQYGNTMLDRKLFPRLAAEEGPENGERARCRPQHAYIVVYPDEQRREGIQGSAFAEFSLPPDGRARNPHVTYSVPTRTFEAAVRKSLLHSEFPKAPPGGKTVQCTIYYRFVLDNVRSTDYPQLDVFVRRTLQKAQDGDAGAQALYGMLLTGLPQLNKPRSQALPWFLKSAQAGVPFSQFQVGFSLMAGWGCDCEENKGLEWLRRAAQSGEPNAEVMLAAYALHGTPDEARWRQAKLWLEQAADSGNHDGKLYLAALLAAAPDEQARDPKRALTLVEQVFHGVDDDPTAFEVRAAAQASAADFKAAVASETKAIDMARRLSWDITALSERLTRYTANQPWYGALLDF
jgi:TPR repeat protein